MIPISKYILNASKSVQLNELHAFCVYGIHGFYVFPMGFFISYLRHICGTSYVAKRYNLNRHKPFIKRKICQEVITTSKESVRSVGKSSLPRHSHQSIVALLVPRGHTRKDKSQKKRKSYGRHIGKTDSINQRVLDR